MTTRLKLMIVDDEPEVGEILGVLLEEAFDCEVFSDAQIALDCLKKSDYSIIITDLEMPKLNGVRFIQCVRDINTRCTIFVSTGHDADHPKVQEALLAGANGVLPKPFLDPNSLISNIQKALPA